ncbi:TM2 domain-containing protein [Giardia duodenalis]|uniref:TM2 domain-containing protein n=1 Tax=Giardia intestinalis (strain ATCC 50803 / WB clone C6) TaxID=184922 RepID=A8BB93_GIAIC|nr:TM2 domain-containing protein [Giardia intestinalis]KAE8302054.1 TM2 domain-containing protein [Giardia intestinalis]|eukprot:XP_001708238.1 Hypothetical protein GL50803_8505 [Giardia lamblia ATCC 50803]
MATFEGEKSVSVTYILWFFLGVFGAHRFYLRRWCTAVLWLLTGGILGIGWLVDLFLNARMVELYNKAVHENNANVISLATQGQNTKTSTSYLSECTPLV